MGTFIEKRFRTNATRFAIPGFAGGDRVRWMRVCESSSESCGGEEGSNELSLEEIDPVSCEEVRDVGDPGAPTEGGVVTDGGIGGGSFQR